MRDLLETLVEKLRPYTLVRVGCRVRPSGTDMKHLEFRTYEERYSSRSSLVRKVRDGIRNRQIMQVGDTEENTHYVLQGSMDMRRGGWEIEIDPEYEKYFNE